MLAKSGIGIFDPYLILYLRESRADGLSLQHTIISTPQVSLIGRKWADLVSRSTITQITFFFEAEWGKPITKLVEI